MGHAQVTTYAYFTQRLINKFDKKKSKEKRSSPPLAERALASRERTLSPLQSGIDLLTLLWRCMQRSRLLPTVTQP